MKRSSTLLLLLLMACATAKPAGTATERADCSSCEEWNVAHAPVHVFGNTYYVGTEGLGAILVTSPSGHVIIDGALPQSAPHIIANVEALGFRMKDVKVILNTHAHFDHAGGIGPLQRASGAIVAASPESAAVLTTGKPPANDPQYADLAPFPFPRSRGVRVIADGETVRAGSLALTAHFTPGHTRGGTTWSWKSCEGERCFDVVYADSITAVAEKGFRFSSNDRYPTILADFARTFEVLEQLPCDILLTPHPMASSFWERVKASENGSPDALIDRTAMKAFVAGARERLAKKVKSERQ